MLKIAFAQGTPFQPFAQLLAVLPPGSVHALPQGYRDLVLNPASSISDFFPEDFKLDMNGARYAYQGVILLPFIEEKRLLAAVQSKEAELNPEERARNDRGCAYEYLRIRHVSEAVFTHLERTPRFHSEEDVSIQAVTLPAEAKHSSRLLPGAVEPPNVINRELYDSSDRSTYMGNSQIQLLQKLVGTSDMHIERPMPVDRAMFSESYNNNRGLCKEPARKQAKLMSPQDEYPANPPSNSLISNLLKLQQLLTKKQS
jgi:hypothetical protein